MLQDRIRRVLKLRGRVGVLAHSGIGIAQDGVIIRRLPADPGEYAAHLYSALHELEDAGCSHILIEDVPGRRSLGRGPRSPVARGRGEFSKGVKSVGIADSPVVLASRAKHPPVKV